MEIKCTSGLQSAILNFNSRPTSHNVSIATIGMGLVENVVKAVGISAICHSIPELHCTSGLVSTLLICASRPTSKNVGSITIGLGMVEIVKSRWNFGDMSFRYRDTVYLRFTVRHFEFRKLADCMQCQALGLLVSDMMYSEFT
jgi:hypothetical protein